MVNKQPGRPKGGTDTRRLLVEAAMEEFLRRGYGRASARGIARRAGCDHTMVNYYFGSKDGLFNEAFGLELSPKELLAGMRQRIRTKQEAARLLPGLLAHAIFRYWEDPRFRGTAMPIIDQVFLQRSVDLQNLFREFVEQGIYSELRGLLYPFYGAGATQRAAGITVVVGGLIVTRYVAGVGPMAEMPGRDAQAVIERLIASQLA